MRTRMMTFVDKIETLDGHSNIFFFLKESGRTLGSGYTREEDDLNRILQKYFGQTLLHSILPHLSPKVAQF